MGEVIELTKQPLWLTLILSGPPVGAAAPVVLLVALLQAANQLQDHTFAYTLKFFPIFVTLFITVAQNHDTLHTFSDRIFSRFSGIVQHFPAPSPPLHDVLTI